MAHGHSHGGGSDEEEEKVNRLGCNTKEIAFWVIGLLTLVYSIAELITAMAVDSLTLLSDGFHNLSDVVSLIIAYWASRASRKGQTDEMTFGYARAELIGALTNATFLLSLCLYIGLEALPEFINPEVAPSGWVFIGVASAGLAVNTIGTVVFFITGQSHGHSHSHGGHGHSHGGGGHGHSDHGHSHEEGGHSHDHDESSELLAHGHSHGESEKKKGFKMPKFDSNVLAVLLHYAGDMLSSFFVLIAGIIMQVAQHMELCPAADGSDCDTPPVCWVDYIDPVSSLLIIGLILFTTLPLVKNIIKVLIQSVPSHINTNDIKKEIQRINGVLNVHDLHIWQLVDGMIICSLHIGVEESTDFNSIASRVKNVLHGYGIHSSAVQPEFMQAFNSSVEGDVCASHCVEECEEDWCCKKKSKESSAQPAGYQIEHVEYGSYRPFHEEA